MKKHQSQLQVVAELILALFIIWLVIASIVFAARHPWMTDTERFLNTHRALMFDRVPYSDARPRP